MVDHLSRLCGVPGIGLGRQTQLASSGFGIASSFILVFLDFKFWSLAVLVSQYPFWVAGLLLSGTAFLQPNLVGRPELWLGIHSNKKLVGSHQQNTSSN